MVTNLQQVESFVAVVRAGSLASAEVSSGISKATLSRHVSRLESEVGTQLLIRGSRRVQPTEAGRAFYAHSLALLDEVNGRLEAARTLVQNIDQGVSGTLSLLCDVHFGTTFGCHAVELFLTQYPNVRCELFIAGEQGAPAIDDVDCYICSAPPDRPNLVAKLLGRLGFGLFASPGYLLREHAPESPGDLMTCNAILLHNEGGNGRDLHSSAGSHPYAPTEALLTNDYWVMKTLCIAGLGVALMPDFFARPEVKRGLLVPILPAWRPAPQPIYCTYQRQRYVGRKVRAFVDLLAHCIADIETFNIYVAAPPAKKNA